MGFMPRKWKNQIITRCSSNVKSPFSVSKTLLSLYNVTSIQRVGQCCHLASPNLKNSYVFSNNFHISTCFHSREKNYETLDLESTMYWLCGDEMTELQLLSLQTGLLLRNLAPSKCQGPKNPRVCKTRVLKDKLSHYLLTYLLHGAESFLRS